MLFDKDHPNGVHPSDGKGIRPNSNHGSYLIVPQCNQHPAMVFRQRCVYVGRDPAK